LIVIFIIYHQTPTGTPPLDSAAGLPSPRPLVPPSPSLISNPPPLVRAASDVDNGAGEAGAAGDVFSHTRG